MARLRYHCWSGSATFFVLIVELHVIVSDIKILSGAQQCFLSHLCRRPLGFVARSSCKRYFCPVLTEFVVCGRIKSLISDFNGSRMDGRTDDRDEGTYVFR